MIQSKLNKNSSKLATIYFNDDDTDIYIELGLLMESIIIYTMIKKDYSRGEAEYFINNLPNTIRNNINKITVSDIMTSSVE